MKPQLFSALVLLLSILIPVANPTYAEPPTWEGLRCDELWTKAKAERAMSREERSKQAQWTEDERSRFWSCLGANSPGGPKLPTQGWCAAVPQTPPPPTFVQKGWAQIYGGCSSPPPSKFSNQHECASLCRYARSLWGTWTNPPPKTLYQSTTQLQGPIEFPGGGTGYILPIPGATPTPATVAPAPSAPQSSVDPGGPFVGGSFVGENLTIFQNGRPPDVAADVSPTQNVEFVNNFGPANNFGMSIWAKPALPISPQNPPTPSTISMNDFWCSGNQINGLALSQCSGGNLPGKPGAYLLTDPQIGYNPWLGLWVATTLLHFNSSTRDSTTPDFVYVAVSNSGTALADGTTWTKWSVPLCTDNPSFPFADQPLLGWGAKNIGVDVVCFDPAGQNRGEDNLVAVSNFTLTSTPPPALAGPIVPPCIGMTPARDEDAENLGRFYLLAAVVPGDRTVPEPATGTCVVNPANESPYVVEYAATASGVFGKSGDRCPSGAPCTPLSQSKPLANPGMYEAGPADQLGCIDGDMGCKIDANQARIEAAQIRLATDSSGTTSGILTLGFATGFQPSDNLTGAQALWVQQNLRTSSWFAFGLISNENWFAYPTTAIDDDFDLYLTTASFNAGAFPATVWDLFSGTSFGNYTFEGQDFIEKSTKEYIGEGGATPQRWGDYNTMIYDPAVVGPGPNSEPVFWQVEETSDSSLFNPPCQGSQCTSTDESTSWVALQDPQPFFVGTPSEAETEVPSTATCSPYSLQTEVSAPSGVQNGDVLIAILEAGVATSGATPALPPGWTLLSMSNVGSSGSTTLNTGEPCGGTVESWIAVHTYSANDNVPYTFSFAISPTTDTCPGGGCIQGESGAYVNAYRFAGTDFTKYVAYGFPNSDSGSNTTSTTTAITVRAERRVLTVFSGVGDFAATEDEPGGVCEDFSSPSGTPNLTIQSSVTPECDLPALLSADFWDPSGGSVGPYIESPGSLIEFGGDAPLPAWQVAIPEPNQ